VELIVQTAKEFYNLLVACSTASFASTIVMHACGISTQARIKIMIRSIAMLLVQMIQESA
jgi:hypothetical protein